MRLLVAGVLLCAAAAGLVWRLVTVDAPAKGTDTAVLPQRLSMVAHDSSGHGHNGVNQGDFVLGLPGHEGTSYGVSKSGSWIEVPSSPELNPDDEDFAFSVWVNFKTTPDADGSYDIVRKGLSYTPTGEFKLEIIHNGLVRCTAKDSTGHWSRSIVWNTSVTDGRWHRIGCERKGRAWSAFADGDRVSHRARLQRIFNDLPLSIGSKYGFEDVPDGRLDEVRLRIGGAVVGEWHLDEQGRP